jgi:hypothetical protein
VAQILLAEWIDPFAPACSRQFSSYDHMSAAKQHVRSAPNNSLVPNATIQQVDDFCITVNIVYDGYVCWTHRDGFQHGKCHARCIMIARIWHGTVPASRGVEYLEKMRAVGLPGYRQTPGNLAAYCLHEPGQDIDHFLMITLWKDRESIRHFSGPDISLAYYYDFDADFLINMERFVQHFEAYEQ